MKIVAPPFSIQNSECSFEDDTRQLVLLGTCLFFPAVKISSVQRLSKDVGAADGSVAASNVEP
jgi:hypothetical protein